MEALVGEWVLGDPEAPVGRTSFTWLEGGKFLIQRWTVDIPEAPDGIAVIGPDATGQHLVQHYFDSRGIARVYRMTLDDDVWTLWRSDDDFSQRFVGTIQDGTITGAWYTGPPNAPADQTEWTHDFDLVYTKAP